MATVEKVILIFKALSDYYPKFELPKDEKGQGVIRLAKMWSG